MDQMGYWHVAFDVEPQSQIFILGLIRDCPLTSPLVPMWIKQSGDWWSTGQIIDSEFLEGIRIFS